MSRWGGTAQALRFPDAASVAASVQSIDAPATYAWTSGGHSGAGAMRTTRTGTSASTSVRFYEQPTVQGQPTTVTAWARNGDGGGSPTVWVYLLGRRAGTAAPGFDYVHGPFGSQIAPDSGAWVSMSGTVTPAVDEVAWYVRVDSTSSSGVPGTWVQHIDWDDVTLAGPAIPDTAYWEPSGLTPPTLWAGVDAGVGWPDIIVDGILVTDRTLAASWSSGRSWWLDDPQPGSAAVELQGTLAGELAGAAVGDVLRIEADPVGTLWRGWIDSIVETTVPQDGELAYGLTIQASDALSRILSVELYSSLALIANPLDRRLADLATAAGVPAPQVVTVLPTTGALPQLAAVTLAGSTATPLKLGDHLAACEKASNAIVAVARDGSWLVLPRARVLTTPDVVTLNGTSDLNELHRAVATPERVRNVFTIAGVATTIATSVAKYGRRGYDVPSGLLVSGAPPYAPETLAALAEPLPFAQGTIPVDSRLADAVALSPFDWCRVSTRPTDELYQLLSMSWRADPGDWQLSVELDRTQTSIAAPPIDPDPPNPTPPGQATVTDTFAANRSAYIVDSSGGSGNGASVDLLVGRLADGKLARALIRFDLPWRGRVVKVISATLQLKGGATNCSGFGSSPSFTVSRLTGSWSPGTFATRCAFSSTNAVVFPGPPATSTGQVTKAGPSSTGDVQSLDVTAIVAAWASGSANYGLRLRGASETSSSDRAPIWSYNASSGDRPRLVVKYTYET